MSDIADFLLARIVEDEADARDAAHAAHAANWSPDRALAECEAKRRIVQGVEDAFLGYSALLILATVYADHPDYRDSWRP